MQIFVKTITGETITLVNVEETVDSVKERIEEIEGVPVAQQRLIYSGREMEDGRSLSFYNMQEDSTIHMMLALPGGTIHRHMRELAKFYVLNKKICRKCYGRLPPKATRCRKVKCGRTDNIRPKKLLCDKPAFQRLSDWNKKSNPEYLWCAAHYKKLLNDERAGKLSFSSYDIASFYSRTIGPGWRLASYYVARKKICRKCYGRLPANATRCRKVKCGRTSDIRNKKPFIRSDIRNHPKRLSEWYIPGFWMC